MKQIKFFAMALVCLMMVAVNAMADDRPVPVQSLPAAAKQFVAANFPGATIVYAAKDDGKYETTLSTGAQVDFTRKGAWDKVDCHTVAVPAAIVPAAIAAYVKASFPNTVITKIDKERYGYEIELSNDLELKFDKRGNLMNIDD
jgi:hypothetical protein